jgi:hypothetical protein
MIADAGSTLSATIPATIAAIGSAAALIITALNRRTMTVTEAKTDDQTNQLVEVKSAVADTQSAVAEAQSTVADTAEKLEDVHKLVNSTLTEAVERRDTSEAENVQLRQDAKDVKAAQDLKDAGH